MHKVSVTVQIETWLDQLNTSSTTTETCRDIIENVYALAQKHSDYFNTYQPSVTTLLSRLLTDTAFNPERLRPLVMAQLRSRHGCHGPQTFQEEHVLSELAEDTLFLTMLERMLNINLGFEAFLKSLRRFLLIRCWQDRTLSPMLLRLAVALAQQSFNNDYLFNNDSHEDRLVNDLEAQLRTEPDIQTLSAQESLVFTWGMYRPLIQLPHAKGWNQIPLYRWSEIVRPAIVRLLQEPMQEVQLMETIPSLGTISDPVSQKVRQQYEVHPYPRWFLLRESVQSIHSRLRQVNPNAASTLEEKTIRNILVPGCGTGRHALFLALGNPEANVTAIDLSRQSLSYGVRMAKQLDVQNVAFYHADLLNLPQLGHQFHHIDCVGVLHHMAEPLDGWRALERMLLPGGTMFIGVYSRAARLHVTAVRREVQRMGIQPVAAQMKAFREQLIHQKRYQPLLKYLNRVQEFYNLNMLRDYLFHVQEHHYTVAEIGQTIEQVGLHFFGADLPIVLRNRYRDRYPDDPYLRELDHWQRFESEYAGSNALFRVWLQKPV